MSRSSRVVSALLVGALLASSAHAQGSLSTLGFGYPVGGQSVRSLGAGSAFGEFDAVSPRNPASLGGLTRTLIAAQTEPEFRTLTIGSSRERTTAQRVPLLLIALPARHGIGVAFSGTTFLDRSYSTLTTGTVNVDGRVLPTDDRTDARGAIGDLRGAIGWRPNARFALGIAGHLFTGDNSLRTSRQFADTNIFGSVVDSSRASFFGTAVSVGGEVLVAKGLSASASYRAGFGLEARIADTVRSRANVPNRLGLGVRYEGIRGAIFAVGMEHQTWSRMRGLGSALVQANDATNIHAGAEVAGPRIASAQLLLRAGYARHTLPFGTNDRTVRETRFTTGAGLPLAGDRVSVDLSLQRANRTITGGGVKEAAWLLGFGVQLRP